MNTENKLRRSTNSQTLPVVALVLSLFVMVACNDTDPDMKPVKAEPVREGAPSKGHTAESEGYVLRANISQSDSIPAAMRTQYGIEDDSDRSILNVSILQQGADGQEVTVAADVSAKQENLHGQFEEIEMRRVNANEYISYLGTFDSSSRRNYRFIISAQPGGSDRTVTIEFEEQLRSYD